VTVASQQTAVRCVIMRGGTHAADSAASRINGSVPHRLLGHKVEGSDILRIGHPPGVMDVVVARDAETDCGETRFAKPGFARTTRWLMDGLAYVPRDP
jgi:2-methylaconitate isomerase